MKIFLKFVLFTMLMFTSLYSYEWTPIYEGEHYIYDFVLCQSGMNQYALACEDGLLIFDGEDWNHYPTGMHVRAVLPLGNHQLLLIQESYVGSSNGLYVFDENTFEFELLWLCYPTFLAYNEDQQEYFFSNDEGLFKSYDAETWEEVTFFQDLGCISMAFFENHYVASILGDTFAPYYSDDYGQTWNESTFYTIISEFSFRNDGILFAIDPGPTPNMGLIRSDDFGATWEIEDNQESLHSICCDLVGNVFVAGLEGYYEVGIWENGEYISIRDGLPAMPVSQLKINPELNINHILALGQNGAYLLTNYTKAEPVIPKPEIKLSNFPNPFNPSTEISFETTNLHEDARIEIYNSKGQKIKTLSVTLIGVEGRGLISIEWNGTNSNGKLCPSGVYLYKLISGEKELAANKILLLK